MRSAVAILMLLTGFCAFGQPNLVQGNGIFYRGQTLTICEYEDLFTFATRPVASCEIGPEGNFSTTIAAGKTRLVLLKIGRINAHLFVEPGVKYTLILPEPPLEDRLEVGKDAFIQPEVFETGGNMNRWITSLERDLNTFAIVHSLAVQSAGNTSAMEYLEEVRSKYADIDNDYFQSYLRFRGIEFQAVNGRALSSRLRHDFLKAGIDYRQLSFANAVRAVFSNYLSPHSPHSFSDSAHLAIEQRSFRMLDLVLSREALLQNDSLRELVIITQLYELGQEAVYARETVVEMLREAAAITANKAHRTIIENAIEKLLYLSPGTAVPGFSFSNVEGEIVDLERFRGRTVYLQFFDQLTPEALRQMSLMKVLKEGYGKDIAMFSLSVGMDAAALKNLSYKYDFDWYFGAVTAPREVIHAFELRSYPTYFLIDEEGKFIFSPAPGPGARAERIFARLYEQKNPGQNKPFKLQPPEVIDDRSFRK